MGNGDKHPWGRFHKGHGGGGLEARAVPNAPGRAPRGVTGPSAPSRAKGRLGPCARQAKRPPPPGHAAPTGGRPGPPRRQLVPLLTRGARPAPPPPCPPPFLPPSRPPARPGGSDRPSRRPLTRRPRYLGLLADRIVRAEQVAEEGVELLLLRRRHCCEREGEGGRGSARRAAGGGTRGGAATPAALPLAGAHGASPPIGPASL